MKLEMPSFPCSDSHAKTNHFFKIILSDTDSQTKLMMPRKFVRKYGKNLDSRISLKAPNGLAWRVNMERHEGDVWLEFARFYSIKFGYLLVFKYRGHCDYKVRVFDPRKSGDCASAIKEAEARALASAEAFRSDKPFFFHVMSRTFVDGKGRGLFNDKVYLQFNDKVYLQVAGKCWQVNCDLKGIGCRLSFGWDRFVKDNSLTAGDVCVFELIDACKKLLQVVIFRATKEPNGDVGSATEESKSQVQDFTSAEDFKSHNPFFVIAMKESYVDGRGRGVVVRKAFETTYQMWKNDDQVILQIEGKTWLVFCDIKWNGCRLRRGWDRFVRDNLLTVGDTCVFELINASEKLLQVFIFRAAKETNCKEINIPQRVKIEAKEARGLTSVNTLTSKYPFFRVKVYPSSLYGPNLGLPQQFIKRYITMDSCIVTLQISDGRTWLVKCTVYKSCTKFSVGWNIFARANQLAVGNVCTFELIDFSTKLLQVFIFRATKETECKEDKIPLRVKINVYPSSLSGGALSLPPNFIKRHITEDSCNVTLQTSNGKSWLVKCTVYKSCTKFSVGWKRFARANKLAAGDVCVFELINSSEKLLNAVIFRNKSSHFKGTL
ncbi:hypothetical protein POM88_035222 [Heracleum sosnowskyi]|uniref:TF-B3 domain-containing protein n=1 Tax=Heracleum sosnowskyi TaxID=360622 RepID=A0AAD8HN19_9APIA|nr:hypothetical protein POM88_035222 [Heracleum sosnowskyi]